MKNENAIMDRIKARIAYHANEHRHTYEIGQKVARHGLPGARPSGRF